MTTDSLDVTPLVDSTSSADGANTDTGVVQQSESNDPSSQVAPTFAGQDGENSFDVMPHLGDMSQSSEMIQIAETSIIEKNDEDEEKPASDDQVLDADDAIENPDLDEAVAAEQGPQDQLGLGFQAESKVAEALDDAQSQDTTIGGFSLSTLGLSALGAVGIGLAVSGGTSKPPSKPILTLANDNGSDGDGVTNSGVVLVGDLVDSATWEYSLDNGATWVSGQGNSFELDQDGSYSVVARQTKGDKKSEVSATLVLELDTVTPVLEASNDISIVESSGANQVVFTASAADDGAVTYSLDDGSDSAFDVDSASGQVTLTDDPDFESKESYTFTVVAADLAGNTDQQTVELSITNLDEVAPSITSSDEETVVENSGADQVIYTATADDSADISDGVVFSLTDGSDAALTIDSASGAVTLAGNPDFESQQNYAFTVVATDGAGNVSEKPVTLLVEDVDEIPPAVTSIESSVDNQTVTINYSESLSQTQVLNVSSFTLRQGGVLLDVSAVSIEDDSVTLAIGSQLTEGSLQLSYSGSTLQDLAGNPAASFSQIVVSDGYIRGGEVYVDIDGDGIADPDELIQGVSSNSRGEVLLEGDALSADVIILGGINTDTGAINELSLTAPTGYSVVNPLSTLVAQVMRKSSSEGEKTVAEAEALVVSALGLSLAEGDSLSEYDPLSDDSDAALGNRIVTAQIATVLAVATSSATDAEAAAEAQSTALENLAVLIEDSASTDTDVTLDAETVTALLVNAQGASLVSVAALEELKNAVQELKVATSIDEVVAVQAAATDALATSAPEVSLVAASDTGVVGDSSTADVTPSIKVKFDVDSLDGTAVVIGDLIEILSLTDDGASVVGSAYVSSDDFDNGSIEIVTADLIDGLANLSARITDIAGNISENASSITLLVDTVEPVFTSTVDAQVEENSGSDQVVYNAASTDASNVVYSLADGSDVALTLDVASGAVSLSDDPDHETQAGYSFNVVATDGAGNVSEQSVTLSVGDVDEVAPSITSGATATSVEENSGADQVIYTATADDSADISAGVTFSLSDGSDTALTIDGTSGAVSLSDNPDEEAQNSYSFTVVATDDAGNASEQAVTLSVGDVDEVAPTITSLSVGLVVEDSGAGQVVYTATADDSADISEGVTFSLAEGSDSALSVDEATGVVTLADNPQKDVQDAYEFTLVAKDAAGNSSELLVTLTVDVAPLITSSTTPVVDENIAANQVVYTVEASDAGDASAVITYDLKEGSDDALSIDSATGAITLSGIPNFETKESYSFTATATDEAGNTSEQLIVLSVNNLDEVAPMITSGATATSVDENSGADQVIYTATADDSADISAGVTFSLSDGSDTALTIDGTSGAVSLSDNPDEEAQNSYSFTVVATDDAGNASEQAVTLSVGDLDEIAPTITSQSTSTVLGYESVIYLGAADDSADISAGITYSLKPGEGDEQNLSVDAVTGVVSLNTGVTNYPTKASYTFTLLASDGVNAATEQQVSVSVDSSVSVTGPGEISRGGLKPSLSEDDDGNSVISIAIDPSVVGDYAAGLENIDFTLVYNVSELGVIEESQISYPSAGIAAANVGVEGQIGVSIIWFPAVASDGSLLALTYQAQDTVTTTSITLKDVIVGNDDLSDSSYVLGEAVIVEGTEATEIFELLGGSATVSGGAGADIFALTSGTGTDMSISDFEAGVDSIELSTLANALGYTGIAESGTQAQDLNLSKILDIPADIAQLISTADDSLDNVFGAFFDSGSSALTAFIDSDTSAGVVDIETYTITLSGESGFDLTDLHLASPTFIA
ncbi:Cadherin domain protein [Gammaproteobacteria bacterium MOLA455]|nr:Cadherin domain protein [Gammaproteobacteria bacterium MOLA455]